MEPWRQGWRQLTRVLRAPCWGSKVPHWEIKVAVEGIDNRGFREQSGTKKQPNSHSQFKLFSVSRALSEGDRCFFVLFIFIGSLISFFPKSLSTEDKQHYSLVPNSHWLSVCEAGFCRSAVVFIGFIYEVINIYLLFIIWWIWRNLIKEENKKKLWTHHRGEMHVPGKSKP